MTRGIHPKTLAKWLDDWQCILRLRDWQITVALVRHAIAPADGVGWCNHVLQHRSAVIEILDPRDYPPTCANDPEEVLVHELLHIHFAPFEYEKRDSPEGDAQEQAINMIAGALVKLKRSLR
jgi:hypothetical protein